MIESITGTMNKMRQAYQNFLTDKDPVRTQLQVRVEVGRFAFVIFKFSKQFSSNQTYLGVKVTVEGESSSMFNRCTSFMDGSTWCEPNMPGIARYIQERRRSHGIEEEG